MHPYCAVQPSDWGTQMWVTCRQNAGQLAVEFNNRALCNRGKRPCQDPERAACPEAHYGWHDYSAQGTESTAHSHQAGIIPGAFRASGRKPLSQGNSRAPA
jgi:hypothetical protein